MMVKKKLGDRVREKRQLRDLSQNSLAENAKISLRTVSDMKITKVILNWIPYLLWKIIWIFLWMRLSVWTNQNRVLPCRKL